MDRLCHNTNADDDEDEALSLSDLPLHLADEDSLAGVGQSRTEEGRGDDRDRAESRGTGDPEFDFGSRAVGSASSDWRMCAADELFFRGQILPLRLSVSSVDARRSVSRSDSMEIGSISARVSSMGSSRSNSHGSSHYSSSSSSRSSSMTSSSRASFNRVNPFHAHPSPKPQIGPPPGKFRTRSLRSPPSSMWEFFRLGLIRTPDIGLAELRVRKSPVNGGPDNQCLISRNSSSSSSDGGVDIKIKNVLENKNDKNNKSENRERFLHGSFHGGVHVKIKNAEEKTNADKKKKSNNRERFLNGSFLGGCRCSADAVSSSVFGVKGGGQGRASNVEDDEEVIGKIRLMTTETTTAEGKRRVSRHRTFEWIKELSHANYPVDS